MLMAKERRKWRLITVAMFTKTVDDWLSFLVRPLWPLVFSHDLSVLFHRAPMFEKLAGLALTFDEYCERVHARCRPADFLISKNSSYSPASICYINFCTTVSNLLSTQFYATTIEARRNCAGLLVDVSSDPAFSLVFSHTMQKLSRHGAWWI